VEVKSIQSSFSKDMPPRDTLDKRDGGSVKKCVEEMEQKTKKYLCGIEKRPRLNLRKA
jgi:hypothetical protein